MAPTFLNDGLSISFLSKSLSTTFVQSNDFNVAGHWFIAGRPLARTRFNTSTVSGEVPGVPTDVDNDTVICRERTH